MNLVAVLRWIREHKASAAGLVLVVAGCLALVQLARRVHHLRFTPAAAVAAGVAPASADDARPRLGAVPMRDDPASAAATGPPRRDGGAPATPATADAAVDAARRTGDRRAMAEALRANAAFLDVGNSTGDAAVDRQLREWAAAVVGCELTGDCADGRAEALGAQVPEAQRIVFGTVVRGLRERAGLAP